jgi:hypothetical protein
VSTDQEYEEQADMLEHEDPSDHSAGPGPFPQNYPPSRGMQGQSMQPPMPLTQNPPFTSPTAIAPTGPGQASAVFNGMNHLFDPYDPILDADPFGLSASMHFPTLYESR